MYFAIQNDDQDMFDFLLENGAKMNITDEVGTIMSCISMYTSITS